MNITFWSYINTCPLNRFRFSFLVKSALMSGSQYEVCLVFFTELFFQIDCSFVPLRLIVSVFLLKTKEFYIVIALVNGKYYGQLQILFSCTKNTARNNVNVYSSIFGVAIFFICLPFPFIP